MPTILVLLLLLFDAVQSDVAPMPRGNVGLAVAASSSRFQLEYLKQFGYVGTSAQKPTGINNIALNDFLRSGEDDEGPDDIAHISEQVIKRLQEYADVNQTGQFDEATISMLMTPRCQNPDVIDEKNSLSRYFLGETESARRIRRQEVDRQETDGRMRRQAEDSGPAWPDPGNLTFAFENVTPQNPRVRQIIGSAFDSWAECSQLHFTEVDISEEPQIRIKFGRNEHAPPAGDTFDGRGGVLAHAWYPTLGWAHFDEDEDWSSDCYMYAVALHEIGHLLGLSHEPKRSSIMFAYFDAHDVVNACDEENQRPLAASDIATIRAKYGSVSCPKMAGPTEGPGGLDDTASTLGALQDVTTTASQSPTPSPTVPSTSGSFPYETSAGPWRRECGELQDSMLSSPEYPGFYPNGMNCSWTVDTPPGIERIAVHFIEFELEKGRRGKCVYDYLQFNYEEEGELQTRQICGKHYETLTFSTTSLKIQFLSDALEQHGGFKLLFAFEVLPPCVVLFSDPQGNISYPDYSDAEDYSCTYHIKAAQPDKKVLVILESLSADCGQFSLFTEADSTDSLLASCQDGIRHYISPADSFYLKFENTVNSTVSFSLRYYTVIGDQCGDELVEGEEWRPAERRHSRQEYSPNQDCVLAVEHTDANEREITVSFSSISLEQDKLCSYDFVEVYTAEHGRVRLCGDQADREYKTRHDFLVYFHSDASVQGAGVSVSFAYQTCDVEVMNRTGVLANKQADYGYTQPFSSCRYSFPPESRYFVCFEELSLGQGRQCRTDYLELAGRGDQQRFCSKPGPVFLNQGHELRLGLSGESRYEAGAGFSLRYFSLDYDKCYQEIQVRDTRHYDTLQYNSLKDAAVTHCLWRLTPLPGYDVELTFDKCKLKGSEDYIRVYSEQGTCAEYIEVCSKKRGIQVSGREVFVFFRTSSKKSSFRLKARLVEAHPTSPPTSQPHTHTELETQQPTTGPESLDQHYWG